MNRTAAHQKLVDDILIQVGSRPDVRLWKNITGSFRPLNSQRVVSVGIVGSADISGIHISGRRIEIEVKTGSGKLSREQLLWRSMIKKFNGIHVEARSVQDVIDELPRD